MIFLDNIMARTWFWRYEDTGVSFGALIPDYEGLTWYSDRDSLNVRNIPFHVNGISEVEPPLEGRLIPDSREGSKVAQSWLSWKLKSDRVCFFFERRKNNALPLDVYVATSCKDYVFAQGFFKEKSIFHVDPARAIISVKMPEPPDANAYRAAWMKWAEMLYVVAESPRFMLEKKGDTHHLHTMCINSKIMKNIMSVGMNWNPKLPCWVSDPDRFDLEGIMQIINSDKIPNVDLLGYVPEFYAVMDREGELYGRPDRKEALFSEMFNF